MHSYQQYVSLPMHQQSSPATTNHRPSSLLASAGSLSGTYSLPAQGYLSAETPASVSHQIQPGSFISGFDSHGGLIGANEELPYPSSSKKWHEQPFSRSADWCTMSVLGGASLSEVMMKRRMCPGQEVSARPAETAEYFTAANDEGYEQWVAKTVQQQLQTEQKVETRNVVPREIKALPGHADPSTTETTNEVYGQYLDLRPKYPAVYPLPSKLPSTPMQVLVKFRSSNVSDHKLIPDHTFAVDPREMRKKDGCYTRGIHGTVYVPQGSDPQTKTGFSFRPSEVILGHTVGERVKGFTWPMYAPTGLELNRPLRQTVSVVAGVGGNKRFTTLLPARAVPYIYSRYMSYATPPAKDHHTEPNPARFQQKQICAPFTAHSSSDPTFDPCSLKFINPQVLPVPAELRKPPCC